MDSATVYADCVAGLSNAALSAKFSAATQAVKDEADLYAVRAAASELHLFQAAAWGDGDQLVLQDLTKSEFVGLYDGQMSSTNGNGRNHYDRLRMTELGICPFCGFGHVSTLDHFASKARYPAFSVLPINLVPACADCNKGKGSAPIEAGSAMPHPYFEESRIESDTWLFCDVLQTQPVTTSYRAETPAHWPAALSGRVQRYFSELELAGRYAVQSASHLANIKAFLRKLMPDELQWYLSRKAVGFPYPNTWEAALYAGLLRSPWFMQEGYRL
ncbi:hypothetical protein [Roseateles agri]|nr:hypothetical protein [Paucibacter sp. R3-3]